MGSEGNEVSLDISHVKMEWISNIWILPCPHP
jgi:hypothetical protein